LTTSLFFDDVKYPIFLENDCNFLLLIKNLVKQFFKFRFRILKGKSWLYNISDKRDKPIPQIQVKIRFLENRIKSGLPGIIITGKTSYYHLEYVCEVSWPNYLYLESYLEFCFLKKREIPHFWFRWFQIIAKNLTSV